MYAAFKFCLLKMCFSSSLIVFLSLVVFTIATPMPDNKDNIFDYFIG